MSIEAITTALSSVREDILAAQQGVEAARTRLAEAREMLATLSLNHPESLVPPQFEDAKAQMDTGFAAMVESMSAIDRFQNGL